MKLYLVTVTAPLPYPYSKEYRVERSSMGAALSEAEKRFRADVIKRSREFGGRKNFTQLTMKIIQVNLPKTEEP